MGEHIKEPWVAVPPVCRERVEDANPDHSIAIHDNTGECVSIAQRDNARRIVACVNFCAGVPTEALENKQASEALKLILSVGYRK